MKQNITICVAACSVWPISFLCSVPVSLVPFPAWCLSPSFPPARSLTLPLHLSPPLCPWGPSPFILTPRAITISVVTAGHVTCTCSSGWSPHAGAIWPHTQARTQTHFSTWLPSLFLLASSRPHFLIAPSPLCSFSCSIHRLSSFQHSSKDLIFCPV